MGFLALDEMSAVGVLRIVEVFAATAEVLVRFILSAKDVGCTPVILLGTLSQYLDLGLVGSSDR